MSKTDEMLEELGWTLSESGVHSSDGHFHVYKKDWYHITFWRNKKSIGTNLPIIDFKLWILLTKKMKELGWLN